MSRRPARDDPAAPPGRAAPTDDACEGPRGRVERGPTAGAFPSAQAPAPAGGGLDVLVLRDPRESVRKCSLTPLRGLPGVRFVSYRPGLELGAAGRVLLHHEGPELGAGEAGRGILLLDCSWRRLPQLLACVRGEPLRRRVPPLATAYPRRSRTFADPAAGLASIEALYAAVALVDRPRPELLAGYRWADDFLAANPGLPGARRD